jgi:uncharacterized protein YjbI with pentapeptide repeats
MNTDETTSDSCPVDMGDGRPCGRPLRVRGSRSHDGEKELLLDKSCLMHSKDRSKDAHQFQEEINAILHGSSTHHRGLDRNNNEVYDFTGFIFPSADFEEWTAEKKVLFSRCQFRGNADFMFCTFDADVEFDYAAFAQAAWFMDANFVGRCGFMGVTFEGEVDFTRTNFYSYADFLFATFYESTVFEETYFGSSLDNADDSSTAADRIVIADFVRATFKQPQQVLFRSVRGRPGFRARFVSCNVENIQFEDVQWHREIGRMLLQDELDIRGPDVWTRYLPLNRSYELVAIVYRQLAKNFEAKRSYDLAEDCYIGAMEMKRLDPRQPLLSRTVVTLYRWASYYGSSYTRALGVLALLWLVRTVNDIAAGVFHFLEIITFQRDSLYTTTTLFGRMVRMLETVFVSSQVALFLLALRRRFRR